MDRGWITMTTRLYLLNTPKTISGIMPLDTQYASWTVVNGGSRLNGSAVPRTLSTTQGNITTIVPGFEFENAGFADGGTAKVSYARMFVSDPVVGGFYGGGLLRWYFTLNGKATLGAFAPQVRLVAYFWRPSTGAVVNDTGTAFSNYQINGSSFPDLSTMNGTPNSLDQSGALAAFGGSSPGNGLLYGWVVKTGDVFVLEVAVRMINTAGGGATRRGTYEILYGGSTFVSASSATANGSNPTSFIELPFDLQFQQSAQAKTTPTVWRDMFSKPAS